jgi:hypothetical protein
MDTQCNCQDLMRAEIFEGIKAEGNTPRYVKFKLSTIMDMARKSQIKKTAQEVEIGFDYTNKKGETKPKTEKSFVTHIYCPFCGEKY